MKKKYFSPEILTLRVDCDIITYSETEEWNGPVIEAGHTPEEGEV